MNALNLAALKRQLAAVADEWSGLSPQVAARIAKDALEALETAEAQLDTLHKIAHDYSATTITAALELITPAVRS